MLVSGSIGAFPFFRASAGELLDQHLPLEELWGAEAIDLRDHLAECTTPAAMFQALERALLAHICRPPRRHPATAIALAEFQRCPTPASVMAVAERVGLSPRRFIEAFRNEVGLSPKLFCRIQHFQQEVRRVRESRTIDWAAIALTCGYYDQSHLVRDFRSFAGLSPTGYLAQRGAHPNHLTFFSAAR